MLPAELTVVSLAELQDKLNGVNVIADCMVKGTSRLDVLMGRMQRPVLEPGGAGCVNELDVFWPTHQTLIRRSSHESYGADSGGHSGSMCLWAVVCCLQVMYSSAAQKLEA